MKIINGKIYNLKDEEYFYVESYENCTNVIATCASLQKV